MELTILRVELKISWNLINISCCGNKENWDVSFFILKCFYIFPCGTGIGTFPETDRGVVSGS
jgi:hypothetical protein